MHSPNLALIVFVDIISKALNNVDFILGLFLDFPKAFDTVNHDVLFKKLEFYGIQGIALHWVQSYLSGTLLYVEHNNVSSCKDKVCVGVPQGSILGHLSFILYINGLSNVSEKMFSIVFSDDSNMFLSGKNPDDIKTMNDEILKVVDWLQLNQLSLELKKQTFHLLSKENNKSGPFNWSYDQQCKDRGKGQVFRRDHWWASVLSKSYRIYQRKVARAFGFCINTDLTSTQKGCVHYIIVSYIHILHNVLKCGVMHVSHIWNHWIYCRNVQ